LRAKAGHFTNNARIARARPLASLGDAAAGTVARCLPTSRSRTPQGPSPRHQVSTAAPRYAVAIIRTHHATFREWQTLILVTLLRERRGAIDVVGIERPSGPLTVRK
jgi:hypothetical protein